MRKEAQQSPFFLRLTHNSVIFHNFHALKHLKNAKITTYYRNTFP